LEIEESLAINAVEKKPKYVNINTVKNSCLIFISMVF